VPAEEKDITMKTTAFGLALASALMASATAHATETSALPQGVFITAQEPVQYLAKDKLIGAKVKNSDGKIIGDVEDLIMSADHRVEGVIMGTGGFLGAGEKKIAVVLSALKFSATDGKLEVTLPEATKEVLAAAPAYERAQPGKSMLERATEKMEEMRDKSSVTAKDAYDSAKEKSAPMLEKAKEATKDVMERAKEAAQPKQ
jgi:hypothetical protein